MEPILPIVDGLETGKIMEEGSQDIRGDSVDPKGILCGKTFISAHRAIFRFAGRRFGRICGK
jgi:hypothetical protein